MSYDTHDTIVAISTASGGAARGMIRVSGPGTLAVVSRCFASDGSALPVLSKDAAVTSGQVQLPLHGNRPSTLPCDLYLWPTERSYTRQPVAEFHLIGSPAVLRAVLDVVCRAGARLAEPGEFTLRAFLAGRLDLTQAEAVLGVIDARATTQFDVALRQLAGGLAEPLQHLRDELLDALARLEAGLDFVEEDIEFISSDDLIARLIAIGAGVDAVAARMTSRNIARAASRVVLFGPPNAGKSSLFNALVERYSAQPEVATSAVVSNVIGTTRDYLSAVIDLNGVRCEIIDTAGIDDAPAIGIAATAQDLSLRQRETAIARVYCVDIADATQATIPPTELVVVTKCDLAPQSRQVGLRNDPPSVLTSSFTGKGLDELCEVIGRILTRNAESTTTGCVASTADRCRESLRQASASISRAVDVARGKGGDELVAVELRFCLDELGKVVGAVYTDDILDRIFKTFCIGK